MKEIRGRLNTLRFRERRAFIQGKGEKCAYPTWTPDFAEALRSLWGKRVRCLIDEKGRIALIEPPPTRVKK
jgi:hypothetical protein